MMTTSILDASPSATLDKRGQSPSRLFGRCAIPIFAVRRACLALTALALAWTICYGASSAWSATLTWSSTGTGTDWNTASNWGGTLPGSADIGLFSASSYAAQPALSFPAAIGGIWDTGAGNVTIGGPSALTLFGTTINSNTGAGIEIDAAAGSLAIDAPLVLQNNQQWINNSASGLTVNGAISGAGSLTLLGSGILTLTGVNTCSGNTTVDGGTLQLSAGQLLAPIQFVGNSGIGSFVQSSGTSSTTILYLGYGRGSSGTYNLGGSGLLATTNEYIGNLGTGRFTQSGGTNSTTILYLADSSSSTYNLSGSGLLAAAFEYLGYGGTGNFTHSGGTNSTTNLYLGYGPGSSSTYNLSGSGLLATANEYIGYSGSGVFNQTGGTNTITNALYLGTNAGSSGTYNLVGGVLVVPSIVKGSGSSTLNITGGVLTGLGSGATLSLPIVLTSSGSSGTFDTPGSSLTVTGQISGSGGLTKTGSATLVLAANNTYSGDTTVAQGALLLSNSNAAQNTTVNVNVNNGLLFSPGIGGFNVGTIGGSGALTLADTSGQAIALVTGGNNADTTYSGVISGPGTLVHTGTGTLLLTASNTYTGGTILGPDTLASVYPLPGTITFSGDATLQAAGPAFAINGEVFINSNVTASIDTAHYNVLGNGPIAGPGGLYKLGPGMLILANSNDYSGDTTISQGTLQLANPGALENSTVHVDFAYGMQFSSGIGSFTVGGLSGSSSLTLSDTAGGLVILSVGGNNANTTFSGPIGGIGGLIKSGTGRLVLTGTNTFTYGITIDPGMVSIGSDAALGGVPGSPSTNITFAANGTLQAGGSFALATNRNIAIDAGATGTFDTNGNTLTIGGQIAGPGGLTKAGSGALVLYGSNTYTGVTTIAAGTLKLDFSQPGAPPANIINNAVTTSSLALGGGTLAIQGNAGTSNSQQFNGLAVNPGSSAIVLTTAGTSNPLLLSLGSISRSAGGTVDFTLPGGTQSAGNGITTTTPNTPAGILGAYATVSGVDWACASGAAGNITAYSAYANGDLGTMSSNGALNVELSSGTQSAVTSAKSFNTLNLTAASGVALADSGSLTLLGGGLIGNTSGVISGGTLAGSPSGELIVITPQDLTISSVIADDGGATALTKTGAGTLILSGSNTYSGDTIVTAGVLVATSSTAFPGGTSLTVGAGATFIFDPSQASASPIGAVAVPEPGTLVLLAVGALLVAIAVCRPRK